MDVDGDCTGSGHGLVADALDGGVSRILLSLYGVAGHDDSLQRGSKGDEKQGSSGRVIFYMYRQEAGRKGSDLLA